MVPNHALLGGEDFAALTFDCALGTSGCIHIVQHHINRAELVGILAALRHGAHMIATDSLSSMYQIKKMLRRPQDLLNHQHCDLIKEIVTEIAKGD